MSERHWLWRDRARKPKWDWRAYLTADETATLERADAAKAEWQRLNQTRAMITNRAIQRAKYAAMKEAE